MTDISSQSNDKPRADFLVYTAYFGWASLLALLIYFYIVSGTASWSEVQVYWPTDPGPSYSEANSSTQCAYLDGDWHQYRFAVGDDQNSLKRLRLDFVHQYFVASAVEVRGLKLMPAESATDYVTADMTGIECTSCSYTQNDGQFYIDDIEFDPYLEFSFEAAMVQQPELDTEPSEVMGGGLPFKFIELEIRIEPRRPNPLDWFSAVTDKTNMYSACGLSRYSLNTP